jgi:Uma2 family endonuclease
MSAPYSETLEGQNLLRGAPGPRHELICRRLHDRIAASVGNFTSIHLLPPRTRVELSLANAVCPDLALVAAQTGRLWLAAEIVNSEDHQPDTVVKKQIYEELKLPRLWMVDPRYDNVEVYHASDYGLRLKEILALREVLADKLLPEFQLSIEELFAPE